MQVVIVANPANTNALILKENSSIPAKNITALTRLDHNRALGQVGGRYLHLLNWQGCYGLQALDRAQN